jgi:hypothetical protein
MRERQELTQVIRKSHQFACYRLASIEVLLLLMVSILMKTKKADPTKGLIEEVESAKNHCLTRVVYDEEMIWMLMLF